MKGGEPHYDLREIKQAIEKGSFRTSRRVSDTLRNHGYTCAREVAKGVFASMEVSHFYKCDELRNNPGVLADIYKNVPWDDTLWYVKFFKEDGKTAVDIWSLKDVDWM